MAVSLRLRRMGKKKQPYYRIVAIDSRAARDGKYLESIGTYNPRSDPMRVQIVEERAHYWLDQGAKLSNTVHSLLRRQGILLRRHLKSLGTDDAKVHEEIQKWEALQSDKQKRQEALKAQRKLKAKTTALATEESPPATAPEATNPADAAADSSTA